jgi:hypothetical protein
MYTELIYAAAPVVGSIAVLIREIRLTIIAIDRIETRKRKRIK